MTCRGTEPNWNLYLSPVHLEKNIDIVFRNKLITSRARPLQVFLIAFHIFCERNTVFWRPLDETRFAPTFTWKKSVCKWPNVFVDICYLLNWHNMNTEIFYLFIMLPCPNGLTRTTMLSFLHSSLLLTFTHLSLNKTVSWVDFVFGIWIGKHSLSLHSAVGSSVFVGLVLFPMTNHWPSSQGPWVNSLWQGN